VKEARLDPDGTGRSLRLVRVGEPYGHLYESPGIHTPLLRFIHPDGHPSVQQVVIVVVDPAWIEGVLQRFWSRLLAAGRRNDRDEMTSLVYYPKRDLLRLTFEVLGPGRQVMVEWMDALGDGSIRLKQLSGWGAWCVTRRDRHDGDLFFQMDPSGAQWQWNMQ
jgi:hypothetical protein